MIISHSKKFIYFKSIKTAGSSIESNLWESCDPTYDIRTKMVESPVNYNIKGKYKHLVNHSSPAEIKLITGDNIWNSYIKIVCIRNPWDMMVSWFHNRIASGIEKDINAMNFIKQWDQIQPNKFFIKWAKEHPYPNQLYYFLNNQLAADIYIKFETLEKDFHQVCNDLNLIYNKLNRFKTNFRQTKIPYYKYYNTDIITKISKEANKEIKYFKYKYGGN